jgi:YfiH family protein
LFSLGSLGGGVRYAFTSRAGGVSAAPFDELNLSADVGDTATAVARNRELVLDRLGVSSAVWLTARHGAEVAVVTDDSEQSPRVDAMVTDRTGLGLAALSADCALLVLADSDTGVIAAAHCGRPGLVAGVVASVAAAMRQLGARSISAALGPSICPACYEVPQAMADDVWAAVPESRAQTADGRPAVDLAGGITAQLAANNIELLRRVGGCTREDPTLFSYRRDHVTGRMGALVWRMP